MCEHGIESSMPFWIWQNGLKQYVPIKIDECLVAIFTKLLEQEIHTYGSCCGHFNYCGNFIIDEHSVYRALKHGYDVTQEWMVNGDTGKEFIIWHLNLLNNCKNCRANTNPICPCPCSCHTDRSDKE